MKYGCGITVAVIDDINNRFIRVLFIINKLKYTSILLKLFLDANQYKISARRFNISKNDITQGHKMNIIQKKAGELCVFCITSIIIAISAASALVLIYTNIIQ